VRHAIAWWCRPLWLQSCGLGEPEETVYTLDEQFGNFAAVDSLTLPHFYKLTMTMEGQNASYLTEWNLQRKGVTESDDGADHVRRAVSLPR